MVHNFVQHPAASICSTRDFTPKHTCSTHAAGKEGRVRPPGDLEKAVVKDTGEQAASEVVPELCSSNSSPYSDEQGAHDLLAENELQARWQAMPK